MTLPDPLALWLSHGVRDRLDVDGRPLGEAGSPLYPPETREVPCPYPGGRAGKPMNAAALAQVRRALPRCLATLARAAGPEPTAGALFAACARIAVTPQTLCDPVPATLAALFKITVGVMQVLVSLLLDSPGLAGAPARSLGDGPELLAVLETGGWLVGQRQACAGSPAEIAAVWETFTGQRPPPDAEPIALAGDEAAAWAADATGLALALLLATQARMVAGDRTGLPDGAIAVDSPGVPLGIRLWSDPRPSWMSAATLHPGRTPVAATSLFARIPPALAEFLAHEPRTPGHRELERLFARCTDLLPPPPESRHP